LAGSLELDGLDQIGAHAGQFVLETDDDAANEILVRGLRDLVDQSSVSSVSRWRATRRGAWGLPSLPLSQPVPPQPSHLMLSTVVNDTV
jgi:hypothetical protein